MTHGFELACGLRGLEHRIELGDQICKAVVKRIHDSETIFRTFQTRRQDRERE